MTNAGIDLWWIPLGAGGHFVRFNGRVYEALQAWRERRPRLDLYHSALEVHTQDGRYVIENAWPIPVADGSTRGVVVEGPVFSRMLGRTRILRYEVRRWHDGTIFDASYATDGPVRVSRSPQQAAQLLDLVAEVPAHVWGRKVPDTEEMWNSNSVVSWLLTRAGLDVDGLALPQGGRAPGWRSGINVARLSPPN